MKMWDPVSFQSKPVISQLGDGINTFLTPFEIKESEWTYGRNCSGRKYPALSVRPGRQKVFSQVAGITTIGSRRNEKLHIFANGTWYKYVTSWSTVQSGLTDKPGKFVDFQTGADLFTILATASDVYMHDGSAETNLTDAPTTPLITVYKNRVYMLDGKTLYCSALNNPRKWALGDGGYTFDIANAKGDGTGLTTYGNHVVAFTEFSMHQLYGAGTTTGWNLADIEGAKGCISDRSICELNGVLYYLYYDGIYSYTGGVPQKISHAVNEYIKNINFTYKALCTAWGKGYSLYLSIPYGSSTENNLTIEYDTYLNKWYIHDYGVVHAARIGDYAYAADSDGYIWDMENGTDDDGTAIDWTVIGKVSNDGAISQKKVVSNLWVVYDLPVGSTCDVYISESFDGNDFTLLASLTASSTEQMQRLILPVTMLQNINWYRIKCVGSGPCTIYYLQKDLRIKTR